MTKNWLSSFWKETGGKEYDRDKSRSFYIRTLFDMILSDEDIELGDLNQNDTCLNVNEDSHPEVCDDSNSEK